MKWGVRGWALLGEWSIHWNTIPDIFSRVWFGFLAGQGCDAFANLFVTPTLTLNLNTSAYRPHALQVLEACGGTVDTDKLRSANFAQRTSLSELREANFAPRTSRSELRSANFAPRTSLRELRSANFAPRILLYANFAPRTSRSELCSVQFRTSLRELRSASFAPRTSLHEPRSANFAPRASLRELRYANFAPRASASMFTRLEHGREPPRPQPCPIYLRAVFQSSPATPCPPNKL